METAIPVRTKLNAAHDIQNLHGFIGRSQLAAIGQALRGEEAQFFVDKLCELAHIVETMPKIGETDGQGDAAVAHLHYFAGGQANWWITEKDAGAEGNTPEQHQSQAFGRADLFGDGGELEYISIPEILANGGELDLYWTPKPLSEL